MRLELMTYALRKRRQETISSIAVTSSVDSPDSVAPEVAHSSSDLVSIPNDLKEVIGLWEGLDDTVRNAVVAIIRQSVNR